MTNAAASYTDYLDRDYPVRRITGHVQLAPAPSLSSEPGGVVIPMPTRLDMEQALSVRRDEQARQVASVRLDAQLRVSVAGVARLLGWDQVSQLVAEVRDRHSSSTGESTTAPISCRFRWTGPVA